MKRKKKKRKEILSFVFWENPRRTQTAFGFNGPLKLTNAALISKVYKPQDKNIQCFNNIGKPV